MERGHAVLALFAVVAGHVDLALTLDHVAEANHTVDFGDGGRFTRLARFEQFHHARQTARDVLRTGRLTRDLGENVTWRHFLTIRDHQVCARRHEVALLGSIVAVDHQCGLTLFIGSVRNHQARQAGDFVHFVVERDAFLQILELDGAADLGHDRVGVGIPLTDGGADFNLRTVFDAKLCARTRWGSARARGPCRR